MNLEQLHQLHTQQLARSFGVANSQEAIKDDRAARALGTTDENRSETDKSKVEY
jgi:hypothetical protein